MATGCLNDGDSVECRLVRAQVTTVEGDGFGDPDPPLGRLLRVATRPGREEVNHTGEARKIPP